MCDAQRPVAILVQVFLTCVLFPLEQTRAETVLFNMETVRHKPSEVVGPDEKKMPIGTAELVEGKVGKAVKFSFAQASAPGFMIGTAAGNEDWSRAAGFSFYVKGDGSTNWGGLQLIDKNDYALRYGFCFSIDSTEWRKVIVPWQELVPELAGPLVKGPEGYDPSAFGNIWFGKWFYWRDYPACSYAIDEVVLEPNLPERSSTDAAKWSPGLTRVRAQLASRKPVKIVTMGDSLTDKRHWANRELLWAEELVRRMKERWGSEVSLVNPAIGGSTLSQNLILMPRWLKETPRPDLVVIWFGFNDWDTGVRGQRFREYLEYGIERVRRQTGGSADLLLLTTCPALKRWETMRELEQAVADAAREKQTGLADIAAEFRRAGTAEAAAKKGYWAWDNVHLGTNGQRLVAEAVIKVIQE